MGEGPGGLDINGSVVDVANVANVAYCSLGPSWGKLVHDGVALPRPVSEAALSTETEQHLLTVAEVAEVMRVSTMTVYRLIHSGELTATRVGRSYRIWAGDVNEYLRRGKA